MEAKPQLCFYDFLPLIVSWWKKFLKLLLSNLLAQWGFFKANETENPIVNTHMHF